MVSPLVETFTLLFVVPPKYNLPLPMFFGVIPKPGTAVMAVTRALTMESVVEVAVNGTAMSPAVTLLLLSNSNVTGLAAPLLMNKLSAIGHAAGRYLEHITRIKFECLRGRSIAHLECLSVRDLIAIGNRERKLIIVHQLHDIRLIRLPHTRQRSQANNLINGIVAERVIDSVCQKDVVSEQQYFAGGHGRIIDARTVDGIGRRSPIEELDREIGQRRSRELRGRAAARNAGVNQERVGTREIRTVDRTTIDKPVLADARTRFGIRSFTRNNPFKSVVGAKIGDGGIPSTAVTEPAQGDLAMKRSNCRSLASLLSSNSCFSRRSGTKDQYSAARWGTLRRGPRSSSYCYLDTTILPPPWSSMWRPR